MANIKNLKVRIKSTKNTFKITRAMKLVSAAKLAKAQQAIVGARPYANELNRTIKTVAALIKDYSHPYLKQNDTKQSICLVVSSDRGLCGGYNSALSKNIKLFRKENPHMDMKFVWLGKKVKELLQKEVNSGEKFEVPGNEPKLEDVRKIARELAKLYTNGEVGRVYVAYNQFKSAISFLPTVVQVLPIEMSEKEKVVLQEQFPFDFKYDPAPAGILDALIPNAYENTIYTFVLDALASEHGSRMNAMENASKNCKEMIKKLTLKANKLRQAAITTQLIEVVSGAESLNG